MLDLTITIVNTNNRALLEACLESIYKNAHHITFEVIVVDNNSNDGTVEMVQKRFPQVLLIVNENKLGFAENYNKALRQRKASRYSLLLNEDTVVLPEALDKMVEFMDEHPEAGAVGCQLLFPDGTIQPSTHSFPTLPFCFFNAFHFKSLVPNTETVRKYLGKSLERIYQRYGSYNQIREVDSVLAACILVREEVIKDVGLLDERFFLYFEEPDWCLRIKRAGWKIYFTSSAQVIHYLQQTRKQNPSRFFVIYYESVLKYFHKHRGRASLFIVRSILFSGFCARTAFFTISWLIRPKKRSQMLEWMLTCLNVIKLSVTPIGQLHLRRPF